MMIYHADDAVRINGGEDNLPNLDRQIIFQKSLVYLNTTTLMRKEIVLCYSPTKKGYREKVDGSYYMTFASTKQLFVLTFV